MATVFIAGATGYMGRALIPELTGRGHWVRALARPGSIGKLPQRCEIVTGDALAASTYQERVQGADTFVHLVGVSHPGPAKAEQFRTIDLASVRESVAAAKSGGVRHFVFVSVAHPAPMMQAYIATRMAAEQLILDTGLDVTILRPWYVVGPGHRWPVVLRPAYWVLEHIPGTREPALRLGLVTWREMRSALVEAVEYPASGVRIVAVPEIRKSRRLG